eukprot:1157210-Pelagomonas_calceolata.AAC.2
MPITQTGAVHSPAFRPISTMLMKQGMQAGSTRSAVMLNSKTGAMRACRRLPQVQMNERASRASNTR